MRIKTGSASCTRECTYNLKGAITHQIMSFGACTVQGASMTAPSKRPGISLRLLMLSLKGPLWRRHFLTNPFLPVWEANHSANPCASAKHKVRLLNKGNAADHRTIQYSYESVTFLTVLSPMKYFRLGSAHHSAHHTSSKASRCALG